MIVERIIITCDEIAEEDADMCRVLERDIKKVLRSHNMDDNIDFELET